MTLGTYAKAVTADKRNVQETVMNLFLPKTKHEWTRTIDLYRVNDARFNLFNHLPIQMSTLGNAKNPKETLIGPLLDPRMDPRDVPQK
jgi:hypothetical protein